MMPMSRRSFDGLHGHRLKSASAQLLAYPYTTKVRQIRYLPGQPAFVGDDLNLWRGSTLQPLPGECPLIDELVSHLLPIAEERSHVLDVLACHLRSPGTKIKHGVMLRGPQGSGKNTFVDAVLSRLVGPANLRILGGEALLSRFNNELMNVQVLAIDEVVHRDGWEIANRLKPLITEGELLFEAKGESRRAGTTPRLLFLLSNDQAPLPIEDGDRRFFVPEYGPGRLASNFYDQLHASLDKEVAAFLHQVLSRDLSHFNPAAPPPMTRAKEDVAAIVRPALERQLREWLDEKIGPFGRDVILLRAVLRELQQAGYAQVNEGQLTKALRSLGAVSLGQLPPSSGWNGRPRCWATRRTAMWKTANPTAWMHELLSDKHSHSPHSPSETTEKVA